ncbi:MULTISPECIES: DUF3322 domain-containing protein [unclassified Undibacterium]|uniref:DUF3322 domain-containing protein n=1 Tax=unclassified Undibacterium TaxID=2630295 RepID=UPI002AC9D998|nr:MULTISPECIES: DUF3322 domain-containing protein [unclassified Undibacterium]MEB0140722.1 DUF3322 domain-containing protein [Undibacterium sp. CCC2.1]MEB0173743.1 DUF3322 domain-containing protein [Undibacterium sp. CCC1.1]MEB0178055.1 DUF3322 domain-containing protein [Undibacterium sp. CCC3.4]MEB0216907.1 DUF3322 domain-containing protein [Undibacterium sp. 5I2]WPX41973.1 DUF3322 domain-containing protein [Undibacterium sp. CCC3.4]
MSWDSVVEVKAQLQRLWQRGELLREAVHGRSRFPLRVALSTPNTADITHRFEAVRAWATALAAESVWRIEWQEVAHRVQGSQRLPQAVCFDSQAQALRCLGKQTQWERFASLVAQTRQVRPVLLPWLEKYPLQALELATEWPQLLAVVDWLEQHPRPGMYVRQVDLPGVATKFIENHRAVLTQLLDLALPAAAIDQSKTGTAQFAARFGFRDKPLRIRCRLLDPALLPSPALACADLTLDATSFSRLDLPLKRVFITENEINFLAFPEMQNSMVIFGAGYGWDALARSQWLHDCQIYYWGDLDTHGFAILNQLRLHFRHVESLLMDQATLHEHVAFWGHEEKPVRAELGLLTPAEAALYDDLRDNRLRPGLRLEQEHIRYHWLTAQLSTL